jgi:hypothetical protein
VTQGTDTVNYRLDPATEAAADGWNIVIRGSTDLYTGRTIVALRCADCDQSLGVSADYIFPLDYIRPLVLTHITRSHGYAVNPVRIDPTARN